MKDTQKLVVSFYKYVKINDSLEFQQQHLEFCKELGLKGRIMVGEEGINGCVCGPKDIVEEYKKNLRSNPLFSDIDFKEQLVDKPAYRKMFVRLRKEIVNFGFDVDLKNTASYMTPKELKESLDKKEDIVLVDMRNDYEAKIGKFRNARTVSMCTFRELPEKLNEIEDIKDKKIVTYCTGGVRCEKASAFLKEHGFSNVSQLKGGILSFCNEFPDTYWEGKCFVFDDRLAVPMNKNHEPIDNCVWCGVKSDEIMNCHNLDCDKLFISCDGCKEKHNTSCCEGCRVAPKRRKVCVLIQDS
ncbi:hypothetical protein CMO83_03860 [Candidatus Woesearchaeota archaeon]|jgi:UPF0176 protein|nr:hypothetical protein [Candidatus Woesearchaeota archaeon]MAG91785.1 hypothetical protein [Candidatus Woesearchaeota archaeon]|tara:strand:+ start:26338 stop:27234 length:897 start_codon:yes stop_codon:yes gene_type:complete